MAHHTTSRDERETADEPSTVPRYSIAQLFDFLLTMAEREAGELDPLCAASIYLPCSTSPAPPAS